MAPAWVVAPAGSPPWVGELPLKLDPTTGGGNAFWETDSGCQCTRRGRAAKSRPSGVIFFLANRVAWDPRRARPPGAQENYISNKSPERELSDGTKIFCAPGGERGFFYKSSSLVKYNAVLSIFSAQWPIKGPNAPRSRTRVPAASIPNKTSRSLAPKHPGVGFRHVLTRSAKSVHAACAGLSATKRTTLMAGEVIY